MDEVQALEVGESRTREQLPKTLGVLSGGLTVLVFVMIHDLWISDIWFNIGPMVFSGAVCGLVIVWSYSKAVPKHSPRRWFVYNGFNTGLLVVLGAVSFLVLDPKFTMAEAMVMDDALAELIPPALPLMIGAILVGTLLLWYAYGRRSGTLVPILVTQVLLVFLVGHNLAILGLVELSADLVTVFGEFIGLTAYLGVGFAAGLMLLMQVRSSFR
ncbi:MAG: hypothetical protein V3S32_09660 [Acidimicrobiia bacterium]